MLTRGNIEEKVECAFQIYDTNEKGYLDKETYKKFVDTMIHASVFLNTHQAEEFDKTLGLLKERLLKLAEGKEIIKFIEIQNTIRADRLIEEFENIEQNRQRGTTVAKIKNSLETKTKEAPREVINESSEEDSEESNSPSNKIRSAKLGV